MKKKKLLKRIETLEFKLDEFMYLHDHGVALIERLNNQVIELTRTGRVTTNEPF